MSCNLGLNHDDTVSGTGMNGGYTWNGGLTDQTEYFCALFGAGCQFYCSNITLGAGLYMKPAGKFCQGFDI